MSVKLGSIV